MIYLPDGSIAHNKDDLIAEFNRICEFIEEHRHEPHYQKTLRKKADEATQLLHEIGPEAIEKLQAELRKNMENGASPN